MLGKAERVGYWHIGDELGDFVLNEAELLTDDAWRFVCEWADQCR